MAPERRLLIDWVYHRAVGHAVEGCKVASQFAGPGVEVSLLLNAATATELAPCVTGVKNVYGVDLANIAASLASVPREWDCLFTDPRHDAHGYPPDLEEAFSQARAYFRAEHVNRGWFCPGFPPM